MKVVNYTDLRVNMKKWMDSVIDDVEEVVIKRKGNKDLVLVSLEEYSSLKETQYLLSGKNRAFILNAVENINEGKTVAQNLLEE